MALKIDTNVKPGKKYRDTVSGFEGVATAVYAFMNGCVRVELTGKIKDGESKIPTLVFDHEQLEDVEEPKVATQKRGRGTGGPQTHEAVSR